MRLHAPGGRLPRPALPAVWPAALVACLAACMAAVGLPPGIAAAQRAEPLPHELEGVGVTERLDAQVPLELRFRDETGAEVPLGAYFRDGKPVILNLGYYGCPMLCGLVLNGLTDGLKQLSWTPGRQFRVVTLSIDHTESPALAKLKKQNYIKELNRPEAAAGWPYLTGREEDILALTETVGFGFRWNEARKEYAHAAVLLVLTPDGRVSRYLYGIQFDAQTLRLALVEAAAGKIGSPLDQVLLFCFQYDAHEGRFVLAAVKLMRAAGLTTAAVLGIILFALWRREKRGRRARS